MENTLLDHDEFQQLDPNHLIIASSGKRFANHLIDTIGFYFFAFFCGMLFPSAFVAESGMGILGQWIFIIAIILAYYTLLEGSLRGKTLGKLITRTRAVDLDGEPVDFHRAFIRSLCRLIPFEAFSFLGGGLGWHDTVSNTQVVEDDGHWD